jgi:hypothetical protein
MIQPGPQSLAGNADRLSRTGALVRALFDPGHILAATDADRAAFDADRGMAKLEEMSRIAVAVVDVVEPSGPSARSIRHQTVENRHADKRAAPLRRVGIVLVGPGPTGLWS